MFKKNLMVLISLILILSLTACAGGSAVNHSSDGGNSSVSSDSGFRANLKAQIQNCTPIVDYEKNTSVDKMDTVTFGLDSNGEPIEWIVLEKDERTAKLLSKYLLDSHRYNDEQELDITWENSTCGKWLNSDFMKRTFSEKEQDSIMNIFLLSIDELKKYFKSQKRGASYKNGKRTGTWWLRNPGISPYTAMCVNVNSGAVELSMTNSFGIRPAIWVVFH